MPVERIDHFRVLGELGAGGMGKVYEAHDEKLDRLVAVKVIHPKILDNADARKRFLREARANAKLSHPSIVQIYHLVEWEGRDCIVMEKVEGVSLREQLRAGALEPGAVLMLGRQIADGLAAAHAKGLVHRDIKAENIMVSDGGSRAKILDFGLAKELFSEDVLLSQPGAVMGTLHSMSPEQAQGRLVDARSDLFSLGVLLYEMVTGQSPFRGRDARHTVTLVLTHRQPSADRVRPGVPVPMARLLDELLEKDPARRPQSAAALRDAFDRLAPGDVAPVPIDAAQQETRPPSASTETTRPVADVSSSEATEVMSGRRPATKETPSRPSSFERLSSALALNHAVLPYALALADKGWKRAVLEDPNLRNGLNVCRGEITYRSVAESLNLPFNPEPKALAA